MIKAIIFDCFGVLIGSGFEYTYRQAGGDPYKDRDFISSQLKKASLGLINDDAFNSAMAKHLDITTASWQGSAEKSEQVDDDLLEYIRTLRLKYKTAVLSNSNKGVIAQRIGQDKLSATFDLVMESADIGIVKPDPRIYELVAERLNVNTQECLFIDDRQAFLDVARDLGMKTILYKNLPALNRELEKQLD